MHEQILNDTERSRGFLPTVSGAPGVPGGAECAVEERYRRRRYQDRAGTLEAVSRGAPSFLMVKSSSWDVALVSRAGR
jgi:hypothetical protein